jgi:hypothetical protein
VRRTLTKAWGAVVVAAVIGVSACGDDDSHGGTDGGTGGTGGAPGSGGASATGGAKAPGGTTQGTGGKATGGTPNNGGANIEDAGTGGADTDGGNTSGAATGGKQPGTGGATQRTDAGPDGSDVTPDAGSSDSGADAGDATNGDWLSSHAPPCPPNPSFPAGTYKLNVLVGDKTEDTVGSYRGPYDCFSSLLRDTVTLTISLDPNSLPEYPGYFAEVDVHGWADPIFFVEVDVFTNDPKSVRVVGYCGGFGNCPPDHVTFEATIDRRTGVVTAFDFNFHHFELLGTGWPTCAATDATPPDFVPPPSTGPGFHCYQTGDPEPGCSLHYRFTSDAPFPRCATDAEECIEGDTRTCSDVFDGYAVTCCANP